MYLSSEFEMLKLTITIVFFYSVFINNSEEKWKFYVLILQLEISGSHTRFTIRDSLCLLYTSDAADDIGQV